MLGNRFVSYISSAQWSNVAGYTVRNCSCFGHHVSEVDQMFETGAIDVYYDRKDRKLLKVVGCKTGIPNV